MSKKNYINKIKLMGVVKEIFIYVKNLLYMPIYIVEVKKKRDTNDLNALFDRVKLMCGGFIKPLQGKDDFVQLLNMLKNKKPKYLMEVGTSFGGTLFMFTRVAEDNALIISIDIGNLGFRGGYPFWKKPLYQNFARDSQKVHLLRMSSHFPETLKKARRILQGNKLDFLFIDGDHSYEGVKKDFEMYYPLVSDGGLVAFHDIYTYRDKGCSKYWQEIKSEYNFKEIGNIGVIEK